MIPRFGPQAPQQFNSTSCRNRQNPTSFPSLRPGFPAASNGNGSNRVRAPPVFPSQVNNYPSARQRQSFGRSNPCRVSYNGNGRMANLQAQQQSQPQQQSYTPRQSPSNPPQCISSQAIKVNVTAEQLQNAKNTPIFQDRGEPCLEGNGKVKYVQLNWQDLLGGMENLRVCMAPHADPSNPNRQLKVSFGGQSTDPPQAGETPLKVISIQPAQTTERMEPRDAQAYGGTTKACGPATTLRMAPAPANEASGRSYRQNGGCNRGRR